VSTSEASTRARSLARNFGEGCSPSLAAAENPRGPARARSLAQISEFFRTLARGVQLHYQEAEGIFFRDRLAVVNEMWLQARSAEKSRIQK
jgi:hypothetical protein